MRKFIKWTDDEWTRIASHLYPNKRAVQLPSSNLAELKAKDIFVAQQVLPADRHRKLVSIAQGFDVIRTRLGAILQSLPQASQDDFVPPQHPASQYEEDEKRKASDAHESATARFGLLQAKVHTNEPEVTFHVEARPAYAGSATVTLYPSRSLRTAKVTNGVGKPTVENGVGANETLGAQAISLRQEGLLSSDRTTPSLGTTTVVELARPFIEMVFEEFARAFVRALSNQEMRDAFQHSTLKVSSRRAISAQVPLDGRDSEVLQAGPECDNTAQTHGTIADDQSRPASMYGFLADDETDVEEVEVQPLFDPKLPASADSDFKPNIGVVATHVDDLQELRRLYPQLNLTIVHTDSLTDVRCFGHCQRIIALREEVSPATDELLVRLLRHRYVRLGGSLAGIKAQLNAWLRAPGSISAAPKRSVPHYGSEPVSTMVKKRQNRYPRMIGR